MPKRSPDAKALKRVQTAASRATKSRAKVDDAIEAVANACGEGVVLTRLSVYLRRHGANRQSGVRAVALGDAEQCVKWAFRLGVSAGLRLDQ